MAVGHSGSLSLKAVNFILANDFELQVLPAVNS